MPIAMSIAPTQAVCVATAPHWQGYQHPVPGPAALTRQAVTGPTALTHQASAWAMIGSAAARETVLDDMLDSMIERRDDIGVLVGPGTQQGGFLVEEDSEAEMVMEGVQLPLPAWVKCHTEDAPLVSAANDEAASTAATFSSSNDELSLLNCPANTTAARRDTAQGAGEWHSGPTAAGHPAPPPNALHQPAVPGLAHHTSIQIDTLCESSEWATSEAMDSRKHVGCMEISSSHCVSPPPGKVPGTPPPPEADTAAGGGINQDSDPQLNALRFISEAIDNIKKIADYNPRRELVPKIFQWVGKLSQLSVALAAAPKAENGLSALRDSAAVIQLVLQEVDYMRDLGGSGFEVLGCLCLAGGALRAALRS